MFNLENAIQTWKLELRSNPAFEDGDIAELESHLREEIERLQAEGLTEEEAFRKASEEIGQPDSIGDELYKTRTIKLDANPPWKQSSWIPTLLPNYLKVAMRNMKRDPVNSFINIFGLTVGLASAIIIFLFVRHEMNYDRFHEKTDRIFRLTYEFDRGTGPRHYATSSPPMGPALERDFPEVEQTGRFRYAGQNLIRYGDQVFLEDGIFFVDDSIFEVFTFPLANGDEKSALKEPGTVVISHEMSQKYFGDENPMGRQIKIDYRENPLELTVTGVLEPIPANSHFSINFLMPFETFPVSPDSPVTLEDWGWISFYTYVLLNEGANTEAVQAKLPEFIQTYREPNIASRSKLFLQPLTEVHFNSGLIEYPGQKATGNKPMLYGLSAAGIFLLLIACFNFMNLSTARSIRRAKEAGMRKVCGAFKTHLAAQFLGESLVISFLSLGIALIGLDFLVGLLNSALSLDIILSWADYWNIIPLFVGIALFTGLIGGSYPAFIISTFRPAEALKGEIKRGGKIIIRKVLVITQFALATILIIGAFFVLKQMKFIQNKELGFDEEQVLVINLLNGEARQKYRILRDRLLQRTDVLAVSSAGGNEMFDNSQGSVPIYPEGITDEEGGYPMNIYGVNYDFFKTMDIHVVQGRSLSPDVASDSAHGIMVNQAAVKAFGWDDPVGKYLRVFELREGNVIGVVEDFHYASLHEKIQPLVITLNANPSNLFVRIQTEDITETVAALEDQFTQVVESAPFSYTFLDNHLDLLYRREQEFSRLVSCFTIITFLIACMGLYGLVSFVISRRTKEIGIRKILGSSATGIVGLLSKEFLGNILIANMIAWPVAYWITRKWLQNFEYRIDIGIGIFLLSTLLILILACLTMGRQSIKAALMNPVKSLRSE